ncbi:F-box domain-containing protein [Heracleum sosnowskyi]|uniref:F-box domain-containing protein n=1 Tax=Heracleum sosnowskyi TaxID=360622 RepID=A0AAD8IIU2_9APIA|nr:F-box domain-containing protein [Heracleum sosnowskyi]
MELPNELVDEILTRVPVKYVLRCRCVSKEWCSVIDNTNFLEKYLKVSVERNRGGVLIQGSALDDSGRKYLVADIESLEDGSAINDISEEVGGVFNGARVIGSDNGLVCLSMSGDDMDSMFLLNPCTRKCKKLPVPGTELLEKNNLSRYFLGGFGYDRVSNDYKVVLMACCNLPTIGIMAIVYSLKKNSWTPIPGVFTAENVGFIDIWGTFAYDVLRWRAINLTSMDSFIVGFDLALQQFTEPQHYIGNVQLVDIRIEKTVAEEMSANPIFRSFRSHGLLMYSKSLEKILLQVHRESFPTHRG